jgi:hypothetical protein
MSGTRVLVLLFLGMLSSAGCGSQPVAMASQSNDELVRKSFLVYAAFGCTSVVPDAKEAARLFKVGLDAGREFVKACEANKGCDAIKSEVPLFWRLLEYPSTDFALGQVYQMARDETTKGIHEMVGGSFPDKELIALRRSGKYLEQNCTQLR